MTLKGAKEGVLPRKLITWKTKLQWVLWVFLLPLIYPGQGATEETYNLETSRHAQKNSSKKSLISYHTRKRVAINTTTIKTTTKQHVFVNMCPISDKPQRKSRTQPCNFMGHDGNRSSTQPSPFPNLMNAGIAPQVPCQVIPKAEWSYLWSNLCLV